jgi:hypothetical protein
MSQALEGVESELKVESKTTDALGSKEREYISNKATIKKERKDINRKKKRSIVGGRLKAIPYFAAEQKLPVQAI